VQRLGVVWDAIDAPSEAAREHVARLMGVSRE
jgi:hypothetical protein